MKEKIPFIVNVDINKALEIIKNSVMYPDHQSYNITLLTSHNGAEEVRLYIGYDEENSKCNVTISAIDTYDFDDVDIFNNKLSLVYPMGCDIYDELFDTPFEYIENMYTICSILHK